MFKRSVTFIAKSVCRSAQNTLQPISFPKTREQNVHGAMPITCICVKRILAKAFTFCVMPVNDFFWLSKLSFVDIAILKKIGCCKLMETSHNGQFMGRNTSKPDVDIATLKKIGYCE